MDKRDLSSLFIAACHAGGRQFESGRPRHFFLSNFNRLRNNSMCSFSSDSER